MTLLAGVFALINGLGVLLADNFLALGPDSSFTRYTFCGVLVVLFGVIAVAGGLSGIKRKNISLALAGAVMGMLGGGLYGFFLGLGALVAFSLSKADITD
jgi:membrane associated rhomboid family serine protease